MMDEIRLMQRAQVYGDLEPLLECLETQGLQQPDARRLVAALARKAKLRAERNESRDQRAYNIAAMVANMRGLLERQGKDPRKAVSEVHRELELRGLVIDRKTVERDWKEQLKFYHPVIFEPFYREGLDGWKFAFPDLDM